MGDRVSVGVIAFGFVIVLGIWYAVLEPIIGGGRRSGSRQQDQHHRRQH